MVASRLAFWLAPLAVAFVQPPQQRAAVAPRRTVLRGYSPTTKRVGDAASLAGLSVYQQALPAVFAATPLDLATLDFGVALIRGCRLAACLLVSEKLFKAVRAPESTWEVPVPVEAAAVALLLNLGVEYEISSPQLPATLAHSVAASPVEVVVEYFTILAWRIVYQSRFPPPPR